MGNEKFLAWCSFADQDNLPCAGRTGFGPWCLNDVACEWAATAVYAEDGGRDKELPGECFSCLPGYEPLEDVFRAACLQAARGKGVDRHGLGERQFVDQAMLSIRRMVGGGFTCGQAVKKIVEAMGMVDDSNIAAVRELLGAINYLAGEVIMICEEAGCSTVAGLLDEEDG